MDNEINVPKEVNVNGGLNEPTISKTEAEIKYELEHPEEYDAYLKQKLIDDAKKMASRVEKDKLMMETIDANGWDGLDGGHRYNELPPDSMGRKLTAREILFCRYYVCTNNIRQSLVLAGFKATVAQMKIIHKPDIKAFISELTDLRLKQLGYDRTTVLKNLAIIANQDISDYVNIVKTPKKSKDGNPYVRTDVEIKDFNEINTDYLKDDFGEFILDPQGNPIPINTEKTRAIKSVKLGDNGQLIVDFHDKMTALKQLANMLDMESPQKITLNDETKRAQTEQSLLKKLQALTGDKQTEQEPTEPTEQEQPAKSEEE